MLQVCKPFLLAGWGSDNGEASPLVQQHGGGNPPLTGRLLYVFVGIGSTVAVIGVIYVVRSYRRRQAARNGLYTFGSEVEMEGPDPDAVGAYTT